MTEINELNGKKNGSNAESGFSVAAAKLKLVVYWSEGSAWSLSVCCELLYSVALWHGDQAALYRAITAHRAAAKTLVHTHMHTTQGG